MAAVLCLIFLPLLAAVGFMFGVASGEADAGSMLGLVAFFLLGSGMFVGMYRMSRVWDGEEEQPAP